MSGAVGGPGVSLGACLHVSPDVCLSLACYLGYVWCAAHFLNRHLRGKFSTEVIPGGLGEKAAGGDGFTDNDRVDWEFCRVLFFLRGAFLFLREGKGRAVGDVEYRDGKNPLASDLWDTNAGCPFAV